MSNSSATANASGRRSAFSQTFSLLSQFVKEKKAIGDIGLGMFGNCEERGAFRPTTMNLFPVNNKPAAEETILSKSKSMELFPQQSCFASQSSEPQSSPLTIFYAGQVIVINDFPAHKAKEIMEFARRGVSQKSSNSNSTNDSMNNMAKLVSPNPKELAQKVQECAQQPTGNVVTDLPIARKASLHRFLEKRKDRIKAKAPYSTSKAGDAPLKANESNSWLGLAAAAPPS